FGEQLENRNWGRLATYPAPANIVVVKEFYTNARRLCDHPVEDYLSYVRGHAIRALLLYCVLKGMSINIGQVIANEIHVCANTMKHKAPLGHPSLITHLCELAGVNISTPPFERPRKEIDEAYYKQYCGGDEAAQTVPPRHPRHRWTMDEFNNVVAWPEEQAHGARAAEAPTMDVDDDNDDEFEDVEDEGEEEDSDDSMG
ncbi:hypothetical protein LR48_Vigan01g091000, partial [Vigna angularis]